MKQNPNQQPFISKAQKLQARLTELQNIHENSVRLHEQELNQLKEKYKKQSQRLGGFVQSNNNYHKQIVNLKDSSKIKLDIIETINGDLKIMSNRVDDKNFVIKNLVTQNDGLKVDVRQAEDNYNTQYLLNIEYGKQLATIRSKWWFWLFNW